MSLEKNKQTAVAFVESLGTGAFDEGWVVPDFAAWTGSSGDYTADQYREGVRKLGLVFGTPLEMRATSVVGEGDRVSVEAVGDGVFHDGTPYHNRYHFALEFEGDRIASVHEYLDSRLVHEAIKPRFAEVS